MSFCRFHLLRRGRHKFAFITGTRGVNSRVESGGGIHPQLFKTFDFIRQARRSQTASRCEIPGRGCGAKFAFRRAGRYHRKAMSTAELKEMIDARTVEERKWIAAYLLDQMFAVPELRQTAEELAELARRRSDMLAGNQRVAQVEAEAHWKVAEEPVE